MATIQEFAELVNEQQRERLAREFPKLDFDARYSDSRPVYSVTVKPGPKYTKVDVGDSGKYMVENSTGVIYGIKAYGKVHKGHVYGTLDTIHEYDWSGYAGWRKR
jgi:hypothetical protein